MSFDKKMISNTLNDAQPFGCKLKNVITTHTWDSIESRTYITAVFTHAYTS